MCYIISWQVRTARAAPCRSVTQKYPPQLYGTYYITYSTALTFRLAGRLPVLSTAFTVSSSQEWETSSLRAQRNTFSQLYIMFSSYCWKMADMNVKVFLQWLQDLSSPPLFCLNSISRIIKEKVSVLVCSEFAFLQVCIPFIHLKLKLQLQNEVICILCKVTLTKAREYSSGGIVWMKRFFVHEM